MKTSKMPPTELYIVTDRPAFQNEVVKAVGEPEGIGVKSLEAPARPSSLSACLAAGYGVGDPNLLAEKGVFLGGAEREIGVLDDREGVHVRAHGDPRAGLAALEDGGDAGLGDAGLHLQAEGAEMGGHQLGGLHLAVAQLGVLVQPVAELDELRRETVDLAVDPLIDLGIALGGRRHLGNTEGAEGEPGTAHRSPTRGHVFSSSNAGHGVRLPRTARLKPKRFSPHRAVRTVWLSLQPSCLT
jgi:hypothetical protein